MKILFIASTRLPTERAMGTAIMKQCEAFAKKGIEVELVVPNRYNSLTDDPFIYHNVDTKFKIKYLWSLDIAWLGKIKIRYIVLKLTFFISLVLYVRKSNAAILYTREPELIALLHTQKKKFVELHHMHGLRLMGQRCLETCAGIITITNALKEDVIKTFTLPSKIIHVAPSGIDLSSFRITATKDATRSELHIDSTKPIAMYTGSFEAWKGAHTFFEASIHLIESVQCVVVGGKEEEVRALKLQYPHIIFLGFLPQGDMHKYQQIADVLVVPNSGIETISARHTSPLKILAYMTSGVPMVVSSTEANGEIVSEDSAFLVKPDSPAALADGIMRALRENDFSLRKAKCAQALVQKYDWGNRTDNILHFVRQQMNYDTTN